MKSMKGAFRALVFTGVVGFALAATGCGGGGRTYIGPAWYNVYGQHCGNGNPKPGCNFYSNGYKIIDIEDPYFSSSYNLSYNTWGYYDSWGYYDVYSGWGWVSPTGVLYDEYGYALNKSGNKNRGLDVEAHAAEQEAQVVETAAADLAEKFSLEADVGVRIATTLNDWATLGKYRARTEADTKDYIHRLYGVDMDQAATALAAAKAGDRSGVLALNKQVASAWKTNEEVSELVLKTWYERQLRDFDLSE